MKKTITLFICFLIALTGCSTIQVQSEHGNRIIGREMKQKPSFDFVPKDISIVSAGDSLTQGIGDNLDLGGYIPFLDSQLERFKGINKAQIENFGVKGNRTDQLLKRLKQDKLKTAIEEADLVIITIGGNDVMQVFKENILRLSIKRFVAAEDGYSKRLKEILTTVRSYNADSSILLLGIYNPFITLFSDIKEMDEIVINWNKTSTEVVAEFENASFVPVADIFKNNEESLLYTDYFHPNSRGYELIAERIYFHLENEKMLQKLLE